MSTSAAPLSSASIAGTANDHEAVNEASSSLDRLRLSSDEEADVNDSSGEDEARAEGSIPAGVPEEVKKGDVVTAEAKDKTGAASHLKAFNDSVDPFLKSLDSHNEEASQGRESLCEIEPWPGVNEVLENVFGSSPGQPWLKSLKKARNLKRDTALNRHISDIVEKYARYFKTPAEKKTPAGKVTPDETETPDETFRIPENLNAREGWAYITWPIISGALEVLNIDTRHRARVLGNAISKDSPKTPRSRTFGAGVALAGSVQVYVAEASKLFHPKPNNEKYYLKKTLRGMGDLVVDQMDPSAASPPPNPSIVFGSSTFEDRTLFFAMDVTREFPLRGLDMEMTVPLEMADFERKMPDCLRAALHFARVVSNETKRRARKEAAVKSMQTTGTSLDPVSSLKVAENPLGPVSIL